MRRRKFISLLGGAVVTWPLAARAQQSTMPVIGFVYPGVPELSAGVVAAFRKGLNETGFVEGRSVTVEFRFAYNDNARLPELVGDLVQRGVAVIATPASTPAALAAKAATATVPIVFSVGADPNNPLSSPKSCIFWRQANERLTLLPACLGTQTTRPRRERIGTRFLGLREAFHSRSRFAATSGGARQFPRAGVRLAASP